MTGYLGNPEFDHASAQCTGVLLVNLGTPQAPTAGAVRQYLAEFLWDPRLIELPRILWWFILHIFILRFRPRRSAAAYAKIWREDGSPLLSLSQALCNALQAKLDAHLPHGIKIELGMRYGEPSIAAALSRLQESGMNRLLVLPLYPQYSATTTASVFDRVADELKTWRLLPELRMINSYHDHPAYIEALSVQIEHWWQSRRRGEKLLFSFHGIPERYFLDGDPYPCQCRKTARLVADRLRLKDDEYEVAFQSRFGPREWVRPYADETLSEWAGSGVSTVDVVCPGFAVDCLETLEEMAMENRERFLASGGKDYSYIPALNAEPGHVAALMSLIESHLQAWGGQEPGGEALEERAARARALGAAS